MAVNILGARKRRVIERAAGVPVVHAVTFSHLRWWEWLFTTTADGLTHRHGAYDTRTGTVEFFPDDAWCIWTSCDRYPDVRKAPGVRVVLP